MKIDSYLSGFLLVAATDAATILGLILVRRAFGRGGRVGDHDVGGAMLSVAGTVYAVILGLIVVDAMERFHGATRITADEASDLTNLILLADGLPPADRDAIRGLAADYADRVVRDEWPILDQGRHDPGARDAALALIQTVTRLEPKTDREQTIYAAMLSSADDLWNNRRLRTTRGIYAIPALEWIILIGGGAVTVGFTYFFRLRRWKVQLAMTTMVSTVIALNVYLVLMFGYPYSGDLKVDPDGFRVARSMVDEPASRSPGLPAAPDGR